MEREAPMILKTPVSNMETEKGHLRLKSSNWEMGVISFYSGEVGVLKKKKKAIEISTKNGQIQSQL